MLYYANKKEIVNNNNNDTSPSLIFPCMLQELQQLGLWGGGHSPTMPTAVTQGTYNHLAFLKTTIQCTSNKIKNKKS